MAAQGCIELVNINKYYGSNHVLKDLNFKVEAGEFLSLLGPSGCGKTTILRLIAGLEYLNEGSILIDGQRIDAQEPFKRRLNTVFQHYAIFPHMNVYDNIAYGLKAHHKTRAEIHEKVERAIDMVQLNGLADRQPSQMSGGQRQRVAIARAIINEPPVLLLDEPLTALDLQLRKEMRYELRKLQKRLGITFVYVTHDQEEALVMSDRIAVMNGGRIEQAGLPKAIYSQPVSQFVAEFIGECNTLETMVTDLKGDGTLRLAGEFGSVPARGEGFQKAEMVHVSVRPHLMQWSSQPVPNFELAGVVTERIFGGASVHTLVRLQDGSEVKISRLAGGGLPDVGSVVYLHWALENAVVMHTSSNKVYGLIENVDLAPWSKQA